MVTILVYPVYGRVCCSSNGNLLFGNFFLLPSLYQSGNALSSFFLSSLLHGYSPDQERVVCNVDCFAHLTGTPPHEFFFFNALHLVLRASSSVYSPRRAVSVGCFYPEDFLREIELSLFMCGRFYCQQQQGLFFCMKGEPCSAGDMPRTKMPIL